MTSSNKLVLTTVEPDEYLVRKFRHCYAIAYRRYQAERGNRPTYRPPASDKQDKLAKWRKAMADLLRNHLNPLQVIRHEMRRFQAIDEPEPPTLQQLAKCRVDPDLLAEESHRIMSVSLDSDLALIKRLKTTSFNLFPDPPSTEQLIMELIDNVASRILIVSAMQVVEGLGEDNVALIQLAVLEYLECPEVYANLKFPFVVEHLHKLRPYSELMP